VLCGCVCAHVGWVWAHVVWRACSFMYHQQYNEVCGKRGGAVGGGEEEALWAGARRRRRELREGDERLVETLAVRMESR